MKWVAALCQHTVVLCFAHQYCGFVSLADKRIICATGAKQICACIHLQPQPVPAMQLSAGTDTPLRTRKPAGKPLDKVQRLRGEEGFCRRQARRYASGGALACAGVPDRA
jgi:hypothetical protein